MKTKTRALENLNMQKWKLSGNTELEQRKGSQKRSHFLVLEDLFFTMP